MKKIDLSNITTAVGMPIKSGVLSHLQSAYQEVIDAIVKGSIGGSYDATKFYVLYGCVNSTTAPIYTVTAGAVFFNGEVYLVDAFTFTSSGSDVAVGTITTTFFSGANADPITFTDSVARNVLQIRKIVFADATSGSGDIDFGNLIYKSNKATNSGSKFHSIIGTATFYGYQFAWIRQGDLITLNYQLTIKPLTYISGYNLFYIDMDDLPLPDVAYLYGDVGGVQQISATSCALYSTSAGLKVANVIIEKYSEAYDLNNKIYVTINDTTTSDLFIRGQIFYKPL